MPKTLNYKDSYLVIISNGVKKRVSLNRLLSPTAFAKKYGFTPQNSLNHVKVHKDKFIHVYDKENGINLIAELDGE
jgi:hypothetical protein